MSAVSSLRIHSNSIPELPSQEKLSSFQNGDLFSKVTEIGRDQISLDKGEAIFYLADRISAFVIPVLAFVVIKVAGLTLPAVLIIFGGVALTIGASALVYFTLVKTKRVAINKKIATLQEEHPGHKFHPRLAFVHSMLVKVRDEKKLSFGDCLTLDFASAAISSDKKIAPDAKRIIESFIPLSKNQFTYLELIRSITEVDLETLKKSSIQSGAEIEPLSH